MTDDARIIWAYTEGDIRQWLEQTYRYYRNDDDPGYHLQFPDPASLTPDQVDELYRRIKHDLDINFDFPDQGILETAWQALTEMGLIKERQGDG